MRLWSLAEEERRRSLSKILRLHKNPASVQIIRAGRQEPQRPPVSAAGFIPLDGTEVQSDVGVYGIGQEERMGIQVGRSTLVVEYDRGFRDGKANAETLLREEHRENLSRDRARVDTLLTSVTEQIASFQEKAEQTAIRFALAVAERIVKREVKLDDQIVLREIKDALRRVLGAERVTIHVHPADEEVVRNHRASITAGSDSIREILIEADDAIAPGGCIIESGSGNVDARIETQIKKIEASILEQT